MGISRSIVHAVRSLDPPGRFLDKDPMTLLWHDIGHKKAVEKTSQALRDGAAILRKQLSTDLVDPANLLNTVFDQEDKSKPKAADIGTDGIETMNKNAAEADSSKLISKSHGKENTKDLKSGASPEKVKAATAIKAKLVFSKNEKRRTNSNSEVSMVAASVQRSVDCDRRSRMKHYEEPLTLESSTGRYSPLSWNSNSNYNMYPSSPRSSVSPPPPSPPKHTRSLPNSPVTWCWRNDHPSHRYRKSRFPSHPPPPYSPYHHRHHRPPHSPYQRKMSCSDTFSRSHSFDYHNMSSDPSSLPLCHHSWSPHGNAGRNTASCNNRLRHHHQHSHELYHHQQTFPPLPTTTSMVHEPCSPTSGPSPPPSPFSSSAPRFSKYQPTEPGSSPLSHHHRHPPFSSNNLHDRTYVQQQFYSSRFHHDELIPERSMSWTQRSSSSRCYNEHYYYDAQNESYENGAVDNGNSYGRLSVPTLGEVRKQSRRRFSPKLHLDGRLSRSVLCQVPARTPRRLQPTDYDHWQRDFRPPTPNALRRRPKQEPSSYYNYERVEGEKKTKIDSDKKGSTGIISNQNNGFIGGTEDTKETRSPSVVSRPEAVKSAFRSNPDHQVEKGTSKELDVETLGVIDKDEPIQMDENSEDGQLDDIAMSPLPYDREDPNTLLDLPKDLLTIDMGNL